MLKLDGKKLSVIMPVFNEEENILGLIKRLRATIGAEAEILVIDDCSTDKTFDLLSQTDARVIRHPYNKGNGAAVKTGIRNASREIIVLMDGDGQHKPEDLPKLVEQLDVYDMVVGARTAQTVQTVGRGLFNRSLNRVASYISERPILDLTSGFRALKRKIARGFVHLLPNSFSYPTTITMSMLRAGYNVGFVPMTFDVREGKSKIQPFRDGLKFLAILMRIATVYSPMKIFVPTSLFFFLTGVLYYLYTFIAYHRFTSFALLMLMTGVLVFMMGLVAEQISMLRADRVEDE